MALFQSNSIWIQQFAEGVAVLQFDPSGKTVRLSFEMLHDLEAALDRVERLEGVRLLVMRSLKPGSFCQGPDIAHWRAMKAPADFERWAQRGQALWVRLRDLKMASVAWIHGACFGAGLELALACDRIIAVDRPGTLLGFSEPDVGLVPCWGGLETLLRRSGLEQAFPLVLAGRRLTPREALKIGLVDECAPEADPDFDSL